MSRIQPHLHALFVQAFHAVWPDAGLNADHVTLTEATQAVFGDYQCNAAMRLAKPLGMPPRTLAQQWVDALQAMPEVQACLAELTVAGPGFINMTLQNAFIAQAVSAMPVSADQAITQAAKPQRVVVDFSSPNIAKEMHVGHLRSTVIGDALARLLTYLGDDVLRLNHVGDWGTAFGMLIVYLQENHPNVLTASEQPLLSDLMHWYRMSKQCFDSDKDFKKRAQQAVVQLQAGEPAAHAAWSLICAVSRASFQAIYGMLGVQIEERGESYYNDRLEPTVARLEEAGLVSDSSGAACIFLEGFQNREGEPLPLMVRKSDGGFNYASTDLAALAHRVEEEHADRIIYVTDAGQALHFSMVFAAAKAAGWLQHAEALHVPFGLVLGADGKKFRTRSGDTEKLTDLLEEAVTRATAIMRERHQDEADWSDADCREAGRRLGIAAVKYADLATSRTADYVFAYSKMLRFEGNTAAFLLYAYVRTQSILRKVGAPACAVSEASLVLEAPSERALALKLARFDDLLHHVSATLMPHQLCAYLFELAECFHAFFRDCRVEGSAHQVSRVALCQASGNTLRTGLGLLGIPVLERM